MNSTLADVFARTETAGAPLRPEVALAQRPAPRSGGSPEEPPTRPRAFKAASALAAGVAIGASGWGVGLLTAAYVGGGLGACLGAGLLCFLIAFGAYRVDYHHEVADPRLSNSLASYALTAGAVLASVLVAASRSSELALLCAAFPLLVWAYSYPSLGARSGERRRLKSAPVVKALYTGAAWALLVLVAAGWARASLGGSAALLAWLGVAIAARMVINSVACDFKDRASDEAEGTRTLPNLLGARRCLQLLHALNLTVVGLTLGLVATGTLPRICLSFCLTAIYPACYLFALARRPERARALAHTVIDAEFATWPLCLVPWIAAPALALPWVVQLLNEVVVASLCTLAFVLGGVAHTLWLKSRTFAELAIPIDGGLRLGGKPLLGANKTLAGFAVLPFATALAFAVIGFGAEALALDAFARAGWPSGVAALARLGWIAALFYLLAELPNSFLKRRLGVAPGERPEGWRGAGLGLLDQADSVLGSLLAFGLLAALTPTLFVLILVMATGTHALFNLALARLGIKKAKPQPWVTLAKAADPEVFGGKAAGLALLEGHATSARVPRGVALSACAFDAFLQENGIEAARAEADSADAIHAEALAAQVRAGSLSPELQLALVCALGELKQDGWFGSLMVRSSGVGEDGEVAFAGIHDSFEADATPDALEAALKACWSSAFSARALTYRDRVGARGIPRMGVVIQRRVEARRSGVLFTRSPVDIERSGDANEWALVETCLGGSEGLVQGALNPTRVALRRDDGRRVLLGRGDEPGAWLRSVPRDVGDETGASAGLPGRSLDSLLAQVHELGRSIEKRRGEAQDVEWLESADASGEEALWVVQSRRITTGSAGPAPSDERVLWSNANMAENYPRPVTPLQFSLCQASYQRYFADLARLIGVRSERINAMAGPLAATVGVHSHRLYYNLTSIFAICRELPRGERVCAAFGEFIGRVHGPEERVSVRSATGPLELPRLALGCALATARASSGIEAFEQRVEAFCALASRTLEASAPDEPRLSRAVGAELLQHFMVIRCGGWAYPAFVDFAVMLTTGALGRLLHAKGEGDSIPADTLDAHALVGGIPDLVSLEPAARLWELGALARSQPALSERLTSGEFTLASGAEFPSFAQELERYLDDYGFRRPEELLLTTPSLRESPQLLFDLLSGFVVGEVESPRLRAARQVAARKASAARLGWGPRALCLRALAAVARRFIALRERARLQQGRLNAQLRQVLLGVESHLLATGELASQGDVFCLNWSELERLLGGPKQDDSLLARVACRRQAFAASRASAAPPGELSLPPGVYANALAAAPEADQASSTCGEKSEPPARLSDAPAPDAASRGGAVVYGHAASAGVVEGRVCCLTDLTDASTLCPGDVLVARQTDPGWVPLLPLISGLVTERGGLLSHGAIVARECGIPAVVGVPDALSTLRTGERVRLDGTRGSVERLS